MSDNWIALIPEDPHLIPPSETRSIARIRFTEIAPDADEIEIIASETVQFFDCGANFEKVTCPVCSGEITISWWQDRMDDDYEDGFNLDCYLTPCCNAAKTLRELTYNWPQTFGRFALKARNPNIGILNDEHRHELEEILGTPLIVVYQHN